MSESRSTSVSPTDWIRIFACCLARHRPRVGAEEVLSLAIDHFKRCHALPPEVAAERFGTALTDGSAAPADQGGRAG